ncbi:hypothetical protein QQ054_32155 [Oscillatoria amoena NRMC-F 0135]|nr:hypothetical protein [Oscillatoria amoena NRMC-F 0135]
MPDCDPDNKEECVKYPIYDHFNYSYDFTEFVYIMEYKTFGQQYYPDPHFFTVFRNKWVDISIDVPSIIHTIFKNETRIKFQVEIPEIYFIKKYPNWEKLTDDEKGTIWDNETEEMDEFLSGAKENSAKTFITMYGYDGQGKKIGDIIINPIKEFLDTARDLPTTSEADRQILFAMSNHPEAVGVGAQGGKGLAGSGSGIRNARQNQISGFTRDRQATLGFIRFWAKYNQVKLDGAEPFYIDSDTSQTLDENPTGKQTIVSG